MFKKMGVVFVFIALFQLAIVIGVICTAVHFISKYW